MFRRSLRLASIANCFSILLLSAVVAKGQGTNATLLGTVSDLSGAVISGATVNARRQAGRTTGYAQGGLNQRKPDGRAVCSSVILARRIDAQSIDRSLLIKM